MKQLLKQKADVLAKLDTSHKQLSTQLVDFTTKEVPALLKKQRSELEAKQYIMQDTCEKNRLSNYNYINSLVDRIDAFNIKIETCLKKFKRLTCDWLVMKELMDSKSAELAELG